MIAGNIFVAEYEKKCEEYDRNISKAQVTFLNSQSQWTFFEGMLGSIFYEYTLG